MRSFRFPLWAIVLMMTVLVVTITAIEAARTVSIQLALGDNDVPYHWWALPALFTLVTAAMCGAGWIGYGVLHLIRKTGVQRLTSVETAHRIH